MDCLCAVVLIRHALKQTLYQDWREARYPVPPYLLMYVTVIEIIIAYLSAFLDAPFLMRIKPLIEPLIKRDIIPFPSQPMSDFVTQVFRESRGKS